jgi:uncharacterized membrane protein YciS (DUF1049 family)
MFDSFTQIDTPLEYGESAVAVVLFIIGLSVGSWLGKFIYQFISGMIFLGLLAIPVWEIANGLLTGWKDISLGSVGLGLIIGTILFPLFSLLSNYEKIQVLENKIKATENN